MPGVFAFLGVNPKGTDRDASIAPNHSPRFFVDESALVTVRAPAGVAVDHTL